MYASQHPVSIVWFDALVHCSNLSLASLLSCGFEFALVAHNAAQMICFSNSGITPSIIIVIPISSQRHQHSKEESTNKPYKIMRVSYNSIGEKGYGSIRKNAVAN